MPESLKTKTVNAVMWSATERFGQQGIQFIIGIIIARILSPADYGLVGMLAIFMAVASTFLDSGFGTAIIQKQDADQTDFSTVFYFNILVGLIAYSILYICAPHIAAFYKQPELKSLTRFMSLSLIINSLGLIQNTLFVKKIDFKTITKISLISMILSGSVGIMLAYKGYGVWSLAVQSVTGQFARVCLLWFFSSWKPTLIFSIKAFNQLFSFGSKLLASGLLSQIVDNIYNLIIGKSYSSAQLGFYTQAKRMVDLPMLSVNTIIQSVTFPVLASMQNEDERLKANFRKIIKVIVFLNFPLMLTLGVIAKPLIIVLLTDKWLQAAPYCQLLCIIGLTYPLNSINLSILNVKGRSDIFLYLEIVKKFMIVVAILFTIRHGVLALIIGQVLYSIVASILNLYYSGRLINYSLSEQCKDIFPYFAASTLMALATYSINFIFIGKHITLLCLQIMTSSVIFYLICMIFNFEAFKEVKTIVKNNYAKLRYI